MYLFHIIHHIRDAIHHRYENVVGVSLVIMMSDDACDWVPLSSAPLCRWRNNHGTIECDTNTIILVYYFQTIKLDALDKVTRRFQMLNIVCLRSIKSREFSRVISRQVPFSSSLLQQNALIIDFETDDEIGGEVPGRCRPSSPHSSTYENICC